MSLLLIIDGGGSSTDVAALRSGVVIARTELPSVKPDATGMRTADLCRMLGTWTASSVVSTEDVALVLVGMAGVWTNEEKRAWTQAFADDWEQYVDHTVPRLVVLSDVELVQFAALGNRSGVVAIAGTGVIAVGIGSDGRSVRVGGWGPRVDDAGGGFWLGREALRAVARMIDGRGPTTDLVRPVAAFLRGDADQPWTLAPRLRHATIDGAGRMGRAVLTYAQDGDAVAAAIRLEGAQALADVIVTACRMAPHDVTLYGSMWLDADYRAMVEDRVRARIADCRIVVLDDVMLGAAAAMQQLDGGAPSDDRRDG